MSSGMILMLFSLRCCDFFHRATSGCYGRVAMWPV